MPTFCPTQAQTGLEWGIRLVVRLKGGDSIAQAEVAHEFDIDVADVAGFGLGKREAGSSNETCIRKSYREGIVAGRLTYLGVVISAAARVYLYNDVRSAMGASRPAKFSCKPEYAPRFSPNGTSCPEVFTP